MRIDPGVQIKSRAVVVEEGSGVAIAAMTNEYFYVLTAAHNIRKDRENPTDLKDVSDIKIQFPDGIIKNPFHIVKSDTEDAAILLVVGDLVPPIAFSDVAFDYQDEIKIVGYPNTRRRENSIEIRLYSGRIEDIHDTRIDISTNSFSSQEEVMGVSGGGVYKRIDDDWVLIGIEYSMEGEQNEENSWLKCVQMSVFSQVLEGQSYSEKPLAPMLPPFLADFSLLIDSSFQLPGFENPQTQEDVRRVLHEVARDNIGNSCPTPHALMQKFGRKLLLNDDPVYKLADKKLWTSWVELMVLSMILDGAKLIDFSYIDELRNKRLLLYSGSVGEWMTFIRKIVCSDFQDLEKDGTLFISNNSEMPPAKHRVRDFSKIIPDIGRPRTKRKDISSSVNPFVPRAVVHLGGLHTECLIRNEEDYSKSNDVSVEDLIELMRKAYFEAIA